MQIVIAHGADVNNASKDTCPVFLAACEIASQAESSCLSLLGKGADPNSKNEVCHACMHAHARACTHTHTHTHVVFGFCKFAVNLSNAMKLQ